MKSKSLWEIVTHNFENCCWAMLLAFAIYAIVFIIPNASEYQAQRQKIRIGEIAEEHSTVCEKLDLKRGSDKHSQCVLHVGRFRMNVEKRIYDEIAY